MINKIKKVSIVLLIVLIIIKRPIIIGAILESINIWITNIFPSIFPFLIISDLIISTDLINSITKYIGFIFNKAFKMSKYSSYVFIMSLISGCPTNAKYIKDLLDNNLINKDEAIKILSMSLLYNPILILTITSYLEIKDSILIIIFNVIINLLIGLFNRNVESNYTNHVELKPKDFNIVLSISKAIDTLLLILGVLVLFNALSAIIPYSHPLITGIFEITNGIKEINFIDNYDLKLIFTGLLLSFGGLSIQVQIKSILKNYNLDYSLFYKSRIIHLILFLLFIYFKIIMFTN
ncbi:MAG: hypothetical protein PHH51_01060 [Bacilli bacterium]|nr:hypothetical protein [Bacilli bacterium]MDD3895954.1 hypothetical protein [Bacilli bacterium]